MQQCNDILGRVNALETFGLVDGPGVRFVVFLQGCNMRCKYCHNPETWCFNQGTDYNLELPKIKKKVKDFDEMIKRIEIFGGEPNDQDWNELEDFLRELKELNKELWVWTRYPLDECPKFEKELCDYIKTGSYIEELRCDDNIQYGIKLATSNQKINKKDIDY